MTIHLPKDVEHSIEAAVHGGLFVSVDEALAEAWRCLERQRVTPKSKPETGGTSPDPLLGSIGAMRDAADELDEVVAHLAARQEVHGR